MSKRDILREYLEKDKENKQRTPLRKLARIIYNDNNLLFKDTESIRIQLLKIEGKAGKEHISKIDKKLGFVRTEPRPMNPYNLPESDEKPIKPYVLKGFKRAFIINDVHLPFHDVSAITVAFDYAKKEKPDVVILNGDIIDCYQLSQFSKDPKERNFAYELGQFKQFFEVIQKTFKAQIIFKFGNHELRYDNFLFQKAKELVGVEEFELSNIIKARANGIVIVEDKQLIKLNDLDLLHGHEFGRGFFNPVNAARGLHLRAKVSAMQGDCHKTSEHTETDLHGKIKTTWSVACLCGLHPKYLPYNNWNLGFAIVDMDNNKRDFDVRNKRIYQGKVL